MALAPELSAVYYSWGVALARHGNSPVAEAKLKDANQRGPHWADSLKAWGGLLAKQRKTKDAPAKYDRGAQVRAELEGAQRGAQRGSGARDLVELPATGHSQVAAWGEHRKFGSATTGRDYDALHN